METIATTAPTEVTEVIEVIEVVEQIDYTDFLSDIVTNTALLADFGELITGFMVFFVVVCLCYFAYKFLRVFF